MSFFTRVVSRCRWVSQTSLPFVAENFSYSKVIRPCDIQAHNLSNAIKKLHWMTLLGTLAGIGTYCNLSEQKTTRLDDIKVLEATNEYFQYVYIIRHAESVYNANGTYSLNGGSPLSTPLSEKGKIQAGRLAKKLQEKVSSKENAIVVSSTAVRASQTALTVFQALTEKCKTRLENEEPLLLEVSKGEWEGLSKGDLDYRREYEKWEQLSAYEQWKTPQAKTAESLESAAHRAQKAITGLIQKDSNATFFIVSHGQTMAGLKHLLSEKKLSKSPDSNFFEFKFQNCDILQLRISKNKRSVRLTTLTNSRL